MTNFKFNSLKNKKIGAKLVVLPDPIAFNITFHSTLLIKKYRTEVLHT